MTENGYKEFEGFGESYTTLDGTVIEPENVEISGTGSGQKLSLEGFNYKYILGFFFNGTELVDLG